LSDAGAVGPTPDPSGELRVKFALGTRPTEKLLRLEPGKRLSVGRTKENDISIDHTSVSKMHASLLLNSDSKLVVADTGSTNGTYLNGERIAYGKAIEIFTGDKLKFGAVDAELEYTPSQDAPTEAYTAGEIDFMKTRTEIVTPAVAVESGKENIEGKD
jgi:pSer/pThr/pTyr-binding forkhead associated (FHA) protein